MFPAQTIINGMNGREMNSQMSATEAKERPNTTQLNKRLVESAGRHSPPKEQKVV